MGLSHPKDGGQASGAPLPSPSLLPTAAAEVRSCAGQTLEK